MVQKEILIYGGRDGTEFRGRHPEKNRQKLKNGYKNMKYAGYLSGYRYDANGTVSVLSFFYEKPTQAEIQRRRNNGFNAATWHWL